MKKNNFLVLLLSFIIIFSSTVPSFASIIINGKDEINSENIVNNIDKDIINDNNINKINDKIENDENSEIIINNDEFNNTSNNDDIIIDNSFEKNLKNNIVTSEQTISNNEFTTEELEELRKNIKLDLRMYSSNDKAKKFPLKNIFVDKDDSKNFFKKSFNSYGEPRYDKEISFDYTCSLFNSSDKIIKKGDLLFKIFDDKILGGRIYTSEGSVNTNSFLTNVAFDTVNDNEKDLVHYYYVNNKEIMPGESVTFSGYFSLDLNTDYVSQYLGYNKNSKNDIIIEPTIKIDCQNNNLTSDSCNISFYSEKSDQLILSDIYCTQSYNSVNDFYKNYIKQHELFKEILNRNRFTLNFKNDRDIFNYPYYLNTTNNDKNFYTIKISGLPKDTIVVYDAGGNQEMKGDIVQKIGEDGKFEFSINDSDLKGQVSLTQLFNKTYFCPPRDSWNKEYTITANINSAYSITHEMINKTSSAKVKILPIIKSKYFVPSINLTNGAINSLEMADCYNDFSYYKLLKSELSLLKNNKIYYSEKPEYIEYFLNYNNSENFQDDYYGKITVGPIFKINNNIDKKFDDFSYEFGISNNDIKNISFFEKSNICGLSFEEYSFNFVEKIEYFDKNNKLKIIDLDRDKITKNDKYYFMPKDLGNGFVITLKKENMSKFSKRYFYYNIINKIYEDEMKKYVKTINDIEIIPPILNLSFINFYNATNNKKISIYSTMDKYFNQKSEFAHNKNIVKDKASSVYFYDSLDNLNLNLKNTLLNIGYDKYSCVYPFSLMKHAITLRNYSPRSWQTVKYNPQSIIDENLVYDYNFDPWFNGDFTDGILKDQSLFRINNFNFGFDCYVPKEISSFKYYPQLWFLTFDLSKMIDKMRENNDWDSFKIALTMLGLKKEEIDYIINVKSLSNENNSSLRQSLGNNINDILKQRSNMNNKNYKYEDLGDYYKVSAPFFVNSFQESLKILNIDNKKYDSNTFEGFLNIQKIMDVFEELCLLRGYEAIFKDYNSVKKITNSKKLVYVNRYDIFNGHEVRDFLGHNKKYPETKDSYKFFDYYLGERFNEKDTFIKSNRYIPNFLNNYFNKYSNVIFKPVYFDDKFKKLVYEGIFNSVKTDKSSNYLSGLQNVSFNSPYSYKIEFKNAENPLRDIVIYNSLENAGEEYYNWKGKLVNIDTKKAESLGYKIEIYYSEHQENKILGEDNNWKKYDDTIDKTKIKSLAFKILNSDGTTVIKKTNQNIPIYINMLSPNDSKIDSIAYSKINASYKAIGSDTVLTSVSNIIKLALPCSILVDREKPKAKFHDVIINKTKSGENSIVKLLKIGENNSIEKIITTTGNKINYLPSGKYRILTDLKYKNLIINSTNNNISVSDNIINIPNDLEKKETITINIDYEFNDAEIPEENKKDKGYTSFDNKENLYKLIIK